MPIINLQYYELFSIYTHFSEKYFTTSSQPDNYFSLPQHIRLAKKPCRHPVSANFTPFFRVFTHTSPTAPIALPQPSTEEMPKGGGRRGSVGDRREIGFF